MVPNVRSNRPIKLIFERLLSYIIIYHPAKFPWNQWRTFWDNLGKDSHTDTHTQTHTHRHTHRHIHADENNTCQKTKFLSQVKITQKGATLPYILGPIRNTLTFSYIETTNFTPLLQKPDKLKNYLAILIFSKNWDTSWKALILYFK